MLGGPGTLSVVAYCLVCHHSLVVAANGQSIGKRLVASKWSARMARGLVRPDLPAAQRREWPAKSVAIRGMVNQLVDRS